MSSPTSGDWRFVAVVGVSAAIGSLRVTIHTHHIVSRLWKSFHLLTALNEHETNEMEFTHMKMECENVVETREAFDFVYSSDSRNSNKHQRSLAIVRAHTISPIPPPSNNITRMNYSRAFDEYQERQTSSKCQLSQQFSSPAMTKLFSFCASLASPTSLVRTLVVSPAKLRINFKYVRSYVGWGSEGKCAISRRCCRAARTL